MGWPKCNTTLEDMRLKETPVWHDYTFHQLGLGLSAIFAAIAVIVSFFLIGMHAKYYLQPNQQRHIIRILFMVPVYAAVSFLSFLYYWHSVYFEVVRDCYEAFAIASFFSLLCSYIAEDLHHQKQYFRTIQPRKWIWPMGWFQKCFGGKDGCLRTPRSGLTWFNVIWVAVFQYCFIRVAMTVVAVITQVFDRYCLESLNPAFSHVWVMCIEAAAVTVAMYCLIQFYVQIKPDISQHKPLTKIIAIKLVIFLSFWQTIVISFLTSSGAIKASDEFQTPDIKVGIPAMLLCIEMALFAVFHIFAFSWRPYVIGTRAYEIRTAGDPKAAAQQTYQGGFLGSKAMLDAFNPWDLIKAIGRAAKWLVRGRKTRHHDISYTSTQLDSSNPNSAQGFAAGSTIATKAPSPYKTHAQSEVLADEGQTLLSDAAPNPRYPEPSRQSNHPSHSVYGQNDSEFFDTSDIGVAQTTHDQIRYYMPPTAGSQQASYETYHNQTNPPSLQPQVGYETSRSTDSRQPRAG